MGKSTTGSRLGMKPTSTRNSLKMDGALGASLGLDSSITSGASLSVAGNTMNECDCEDVEPQAVKGE